MVKLDQLSLSELKKLINRLKQKGYPISDYSYIEPQLKIMKTKEAKKLYLINTIKQAIKKNKKEEETTTDEEEETTTDEEEETTTDEEEETTTDEESDSPPVKKPKAKKASPKKVSPKKVSPKKASPKKVSKVSPRKRKVSSPKVVPKKPKSPKPKSPKPKSPKVSPKKAKSPNTRRKELNAFPKKSTKGEMDLITIAQKLKMSGYYKLNKDDLVSAIIKLENSAEPLKEVCVEKKACAPELSPRRLDRYKELHKKVVKSASGDDLSSIAKKLNIPQYYKLKKDELVKAIIQAEMAKPVSPKAKPVSPKAKPVSPKAKPVSPKAKPVSPKKKPVSPKVVLKKKKPVSPKAKPVSPKVVPIKDIEEAMAKLDIIGKEEEEDIEEAMAKLDIGKDCGSYSYEDLVQKNAQELQDLLEDEKIDASSISDPQRLSDIYCGVVNNGPCSISNNFECPQDQVCNVNTKPGVCMTTQNALERNWLEYNGRQIVGDEKAINALRKELDIPSYVKPDPKSKEGKKRQEQEDLAVQATGYPPSYFKNMSEDQIRMYVEGFKKMKFFGGAKKGSEAKKPYVEEEEVVEIEAPEPVMPEEESIEEQMSEEEILPTAKKASAKDISNILSDIVAGKKEKVDDFSEAQNAVLKCLALIGRSD